MARPPFIGLVIDSDCTFALYPAIESDCGLRWRLVSGREERGADTAEEEDDPEIRLDGATEEDDTIFGGEGGGIIE
jgi:hypothetical protein